MSERKWLRDWEHMDFDKFVADFDNAYDAGHPEEVISKEEVMDLIEWIKETCPELIEKSYYYSLFIKNGCSHEEAMFLTEHIDAVRRVLGREE